MMTIALIVSAACCFAIGWMYILARLKWREAAEKRESDLRTEYAQLLAQANRELNNYSEVKHQAAELARKNVELQELVTRYSARIGDLTGQLHKAGR